MASSCDAPDRTSSRHRATAPSLSETACIDDTAARPRHTLRLRRQPPAFHISSSSVPACQLTHYGIKLRTGIGAGAHDSPSDNAVGPQQECAIGMDSGDRFEVAVGVRKIAVARDSIRFQRRSFPGQDFGGIRPSAAAGARNQDEAVLRQIVRRDRRTPPSQHDVGYACSRPAAGMTRRR